MKEICERISFGPSVSVVLCVCVCSFIPLCIKQLFKNFVSSLNRLSPEAAGFQNSIRTEILYKSTLSNPCKYAGR